MKFVTWILNLFRTFFKLVSNPRFSSELVLNFPFELFSHSNFGLELVSHFFQTLPLSPGGATLPEIHVTTLGAPNRGSPD
jgi:hypothetical protein